MDHPHEYKFRSVWNTSWPSRRNGHECLGLLARIRRFSSPAAQHSELRVAANLWLSDSSTIGRTADLGYFFSPNPATLGLEEPLVGLASPDLERVRARRSMECNACGRSRKSGRPRADLSVCTQPRPIAEQRRCLTGGPLFTRSVPHREWPELKRWRTPQV